LHNAARDLACSELWADSLARSRARRRQGATRVDLIPGRKGLAVAGAVAATSIPATTAMAAGGLLERGDDGGRVEAVQRHLHVRADGVYGAHTAHAVRAFQKRNGLDVDGVVGSATLAKLRGGKSASGSRGDGTRDRGPSVVRLQKRLGLSADGVFGPDTKRAVMRFQSRQGISRDGVVGPVTWEALGVDGPTPILKRAKLGGSGGSSWRVKAIISGANRIAHAPYVYGGGHGSFSSAGYDCSGSVSYALHNAGLLKAPMSSSGFMSYGKPGPGKHVTIYANAGHMYMVVDGRRFDTSARWQTGSRWTSSMRSTAGYVVRHPAGL
jgi:Putative peptidoglycan binding domain